MAMLLIEASGRRMVAYRRGMLLERTRARGVASPNRRVHRNRRIIA